jgi:inorganic pyrophosphatase
MKRLHALTLAVFLFLPAAAHAQVRGVAHPWHEVDAAYDGKLTFNAVIEIPRGSKNKYEVDKPTGLLRLDRVLRSDDGYPLDYGLIPGTYGDDHDPLDVLVLTSHPVDPLTIVPVRAIGVMKMIDNGEGDDKIIAVNTGDPIYGKLTDISELPPEKLKEITHFFSTYKIREGKKVTVETPTGPDEAEKVLAQAFKDYKTLLETQAKEREAKENKGGFFSAVTDAFERVGTFFKDSFARLTTNEAAPETRVETRGAAGLLSERIAEGAAEPSAERDGR